MVALMVTAAVIILTTLILVLMFRAVFSSPSSDRSQGITDHGGSPVPNTSCWKYDVFLSFRGEDVRKKFVDHLYTALVEQNILTYKDDETLARGDNIGSTLLKAIQNSHIALIVFSKNYADSSWCLDELAYIIKCKEERGQIAIPVFYEVDPSEVSEQKGQFGEAFSKHFMSANTDKVESWKKALVEASNIAGWDTKFVANGHEAKCIKEIVGSVLDILCPSLNSATDDDDDDDDLVGMATRLQALESELEIGSGGVRMVGIWGVGGGGKTTLATSLYMKLSANFHGCCLIENIREESKQQNGLRKLQGRILSTIFKKEIEVQSVAIGKQKIKHMLCSRNVLVVLDDVDNLEQLEALAGSTNWFGDGSRIIITTRDEHVLTAPRRKIKVCPVRLLSEEEASRLFRKTAYHEDSPVEDYDKLSLRVIKYVNGLPLALKVIGSFLNDKDKKGWLSALDKLKETPNPTVTDQLKISFDGLEPYEKELFLDIACFFRGRSKEEAMKILDACGFHPRIGVTVLIKKSLITISKYGKFEMHDLIQEMGHHIVRGEDPENLETHSRVWRSKDIKYLCAGNATMENHKIEALQYCISYKGPAQGFMRLVANLKKLRFLHVYSYHGFSYKCEGATFLSNNLKYIDLREYPASLFPESFQPRKLVVLKLNSTLQKELWKGKKDMPCLKELELMNAEALVRTPDIGGLSSLQNLVIERCESLEEIHQSLGNHTSLANLCVKSCKKLVRFPTIVQMEKLENLKISDCKALLEIPQTSRVSVYQNLPCLKELELKFLDALVRTPDFGGLPCLQKVTFSNCGSLKEIHPSIGSHSSLVYMYVHLCPKLARFPTIFRMEKLKNLELSGCGALLEFPKIKANMDSLEKLDLMYLGIEVLPSSVGRYCSNLLSLKLSNCSKLKTIEGNFHALKRLEMFALYKPKLEKFSKDLFLVNCCLEELHWVSGPDPPHLPHLLRKLDLNCCKLKDGEIPREIGELTSLKELHLKFNDFSRVDISISHLTQLKLLSLSYCKMLVELPKFPPNLAILEAEYCNSLEAIGDDIYSNCKWLCSFSVISSSVECGNFVGGKRLLESMLQGNAIEDGQCMCLMLSGVEIPKEFEPRLLKGSTYRLQLPENWFNEYTGFLFCSVIEICVPQSIGITMMGIGGSQNEQVFWEEDDQSVDDHDIWSYIMTKSIMWGESLEELYKEERKRLEESRKNKHTWMVYVPFGSLKSTAWWDQTSTAFDFSVAHLNGAGQVLKKLKSYSSGFGARLVSKKNQMKETISSEFSSDDGDYKCKFTIHRDSKSELECRF
uniref:TMV resistance protein N-like n=1 Tax=Erigeron canadensis TaxID=72917 RepID=UPI001CB8F88E|nr:TMV resistance protein N-like [Erigeron canadensis]